MKLFRPILVLPFFLTLPLSAQTADPRYTLADGEAYVYGQLRYDTRERTYGLTGFRTGQPGAYTLLRDYGMIAGQTPILTAGTYVGDTYLAYETTLYNNTLMPKAFVAVDTETGAYRELRPLTTSSTEAPLILDEMTYDPKTGRIFAMHYDTAAGTTDLYEIDPSTYAITLLTTLDKTFYTLTADDGLLYAISCDLDENGVLYSLSESLLSVSAAQPKPVKVGATGISVGDYSQSMEFDKTTHRLWWMAQTDDGGASLIELDPTSAAVLGQTQIAGSPQVLAMGIPYEYAADGALSYVRGLTAEAGQAGALTATLTWTMPPADYRGHTLTDLTGVRVYRNGQLLQTTTATSLTDTPPADGIYIYKVQPYNQAGDGVAKERRLYVGVDLPGAPADVVLTAVGSQATVTWTAPAGGANGGWFDASTLSYDVVRMPDNVTVATDLKDTRTTDNVSEHNGYSYVVTARNQKGRGASATSATLAFGPSAAIPLTSPLQTQADFNRWTVLDGNADGNTWAFNANTSTTTYDRNEQAANDWLVSPALEFDADKQYQLRYTYSTANWVDATTFEPVNEKMRVLFGTEPIQAALTTVIDDLKDFHTASGIYLYGKNTFRPTAGGTGYVAFQACSDAQKGQIYLKDVSLREYSTKDLSIRSMTGSALVNAGVSQTYTVTVGNEGSAAVDGYKVQILDAQTNRVLGESDGQPVAKDGTADVPVDWTPAAEGTMSVTAKVVLSGDTYPADNILADPLSVKVSPADADRWITLNTDDNYGWRMPFWLYDRYSRVQSILYEKELQKKNISITGLRFIYNCTEAQDIPVRISIKPTDMDNLKPFGADNAQFEDDGFTVVYDGTVSVGANGQDQELVIPFTTPYGYDGGNLNVMFETLMGDALYGGNNHPEWHFCEPDDRSRSAYYSGSSQTPDASAVYDYDFVPYMSISYTDGAGTGIGDLPASCPDGVTLTSLSGTTVYRGQTVPSLSDGHFPQGVYVLRVSAGGSVRTTKVVLR